MEGQCARLYRRKKTYQEDSGWDQSNWGRGEVISKLYKEEGCVERVEIKCVSGNSAGLKTHF